MILRQAESSLAAFFAGAGHHQLNNAGLASVLEHLVPVAVEGVVGQVAANVDQFHGAHSIGFPAHFQCRTCT
jgi:hypothetical protein